MAVAEARGVRALMTVMIRLAPLIPTSTQLA
jgi:hypothetical protein